MAFTEIGTEAAFRYSAFASRTQSQRRLLALMLHFSRVALGTLVIGRIGLFLTLGLLFVPYGVALLLFSRLGLFLLFYRIGLRLLLVRFGLLLLFAFNDRQPIFLSFRNRFKSPRGCGRRNETVQKC